MMAQEKSEAKRLVEALLDEGTVIVLKGSESENASALKMLSGQLQDEPSGASSDAASDGSDGSDDSNIRPGVRDKFDVKRGGKHWHFTIQRDEEGQISSVEVDER